MTGKDIIYGWNKSDEPLLLQKLFTFFQLENITLLEYVIEDLTNHSLQTLLR